MPAPKRTSRRARVDPRRYRVNSLHVDPERLERMWRMSADERRAAAYRGELSLGEMLKWASRRPREVPLLNGEFFFIAVLTPEVAEADD
jgi:hypothetical protein